MPCSAVLPGTLNEEEAMVNLKGIPTTDVETSAAATRTTKRLNLASAILGIALVAGWDGSMPPATAPTTATAQATPSPGSDAAPPEQAAPIRVRGKTIRVGDSADDIFKTLEPADSSKTDVGLDPAAEVLFSCLNGTAAGG